VQAASDSRGLPASACRYRVTARRGVVLSLIVRCIKRNVPDVRRRPIAGLSVGGLRAP